VSIAHTKVVQIRTITSWSLGRTPNRANNGKCMVMMSSRQKRNYPGRSRNDLTVNKTDGAVKNPAMLLIMGQIDLVTGHNTPIRENDVQIHPPDPRGTLVTTGAAEIITTQSIMTNPLVWKKTSNMKHTPGDSTERKTSIINIPDKDIPKNIPGILKLTEIFYTEIIVGLLVEETVHAGRIVGLLGVETTRPMPANAKLPP